MRAVGYVWNMPTAVFAPPPIMASTVGTNVHAERPSPKRIATVNLTARPAIHERAGRTSSSYIMTASSNSTNRQQKSSVM